MPFQNLKIAKIDNKDVDDARFDASINDFIYPIKLKNSAIFNEEKIEWSIEKTTKGGGLSTSLYQTDK